MTGNDARNEGEPDSRTKADKDLSARLERLEAGIDRTRGTEPARSTGESSSSDPSALGRAFRMSTEFMAGVLAGGGLGWLIDRGLGTSPWGLIVFFLLGFAAGIYNVMRASGLTGAASGTKSRTGSNPPGP